MSLIQRVVSVALAASVLLSGCIDQPLPTPLEEAGADVITPHDTLVAFLGRLQEETGAFSLETVGRSVEGRELVLLHFQGIGGMEAGREDRLRVLIFAQQHGNEPSGMEAAITLARDIATGGFSEFKETVDLYLIPQVNPDGSELRQRENAGGKDLNRDHLTLTTPEVQAVHRVFGEVMPQVVLDVHEYGITSSAWVDRGIRKDFGQQIDGLTNPNMSPALRSYALEEVIPSMRTALSGREVRLNRYLVTDGPNARFRHSTTALNDGRNSTGIYNALTFLIEGRNGLTVEDSIRERARQQLETMKAFLDFFSAHAGEVKAMVSEEQEFLAGASPPEDVALVMDYVRDPGNLSVTVRLADVETGAPSYLVVEEYYPVVEATVHVKRPAGYLVPASETEVLAVLERHGIEVTPLDEPVMPRGEVYTILRVEEIEKEDKPFLEVAVRTTVGTLAAGAGEIYVPCQGIQSNLIVSLLEPQSQWGLAQLPEFPDLLGVGGEYPIRRVMDGLE